MYLIVEAFDKVGTTRPNWLFFPNASQGSDWHREASPDVCTPLILTSDNSDASTASIQWIPSASSDLCGNGHWNTGRRSRRTQRIKNTVPATANTGL